MHLDYNPILKKVQGATEHFWNMAVIDILIDNNDRNNGNGGILQDENTGASIIAPVYDNGDAFSAKASEEQIEKYMHTTDLTDRLTGGRTAYEYDGKLLSAKKLMKLQNAGRQAAMIRIVPCIKDNMDTILAFIRNIPEEYNGNTVCSKHRKDYYILGIQTRYEKLLKPAYDQLENHHIAPQKQLSEK